MKRFLAITALAAGLTACDALGTRPADLDASVGSGSSGGGGGSSGSRQSSTGQATSGASGGAGSTGAATGGCDQAPCDAGYICDSSSRSCRLPVYGEDCNPTVGCGAEPPNMECTVANVSGTSQQICLVPCPSATDSSGCPYGMSCGDPSLPGYCSPGASSGCAPWTTCSLGGGVTGLCVPTGSGATCEANGMVAQPYLPCDPQTSNSAARELCAAGMICEPAAALPQTLGTSPATDGGYCVPPCAVVGAAAAGVPSCAPDQHCVQAPGSPFGLCLPGSPCTVGGAKSCQFDWWCFPDSLEATSGGCIESAADAGVTGTPCAQPSAFTQQNPCQAGDVCLGDDYSGASSCTALCLLAPSASGGYACENGACTALADGGPIGVCE